MSQIKQLFFKIKEFIQEHILYFVGLVVVFFICSIQLPYYINAPGGIISTFERVSIEDSYDSSGKFYFAYVTEIKATIPTILFSFLNKDWDIYKEEEMVLENESYEDVLFRNRLMLKEANTNAVVLAYQKASKKVTILEEKVYVTYIDKSAQTDLQVGDQIISVNSHKIESKQQFKQLLQQMGEGATLSIEVLQNGRTYQRSAKLYLSEGQLMIGILVGSEKTLETDPTIDITFHASESGPSGGLMLALTIYDKLLEEDLTHGKRIVGTGTIDIDGNVGSIGGIEYKIQGALKQKVDLFLVPNGENYEDAIRVKEENGYDIEIIGVSTFDEALEVLRNL